MRISILTLFPDMFSVLNESILGRAIKNGILDIDIINIRDFSSDRHKKADDYPFGGGAGLVMLAQPIFDAYDSVLSRRGAVSKCVLLSPRGRLLSPAVAREYSELEHLALICGHYEGVDQRVIDALVDEELSVGDYVLTGGELPAMVLVDCVSRFIPGVLGSGESAQFDSFSDGLLEYPQYTRPAVFRDMPVPEILLSGNHAGIAKWRRREQLAITRRNRPDLLGKIELTRDEKEFLDNTYTDGG